MKWRHLYRIKFERCKDMNKFLITQLFYKEFYQSGKF